MRYLAVVMIGVAAVGVAGCAKREPKPEAQQAAAKEPKYTPPPASSPLAKVQEGMSEAEVQRLIGPPDDSHAYVTGKAFIPFYYGGDQTRFAAYYRGKGRVIFAGGNQWGAGRGKVVRVEYDPNEDGIAGTK